MTGVEEIILSDGSTRRLGNVAPDPARTRLILPEYGSVPNAPLIPRSEWPALIRRRSTTRTEWANATPARPPP
jgi:hypothetical protein